MPRRLPAADYKLEALTEPMKEEGERQEYEFLMEIVRARNRKAPLKEIEELQQRAQESRTKAKEDLEKATRQWEKEDDRMETYRRMIPLALASPGRYRSEMASLVTLAIRLSARI
jgi:hypothetical protein